VLIVFAALATFATSAVAAPIVALLPFDADPKLKIYGKPVAAEVARALTSDGIEVTLVGAKMEVPVDAMLIVDGSIEAKGGSITIAIRLRDVRNGATLERVQSSTATLATIDRAAAEVSTRAVPIVRAKLAELAAAAARPDPIDKPRPKPPIPQVAPPAPPMLTAVGVSVEAAAMAEPLRAALLRATFARVRDNGRDPVQVEYSTLHAKIAAQTVATHGRAKHAVAFELLDYTVEVGDVPLASARARLRIVDAAGVRFDRVIITNTIVGERAMAGGALADRVADELLRIALPQLRRVEPAWR
jgi:hypothetical protein